MPEMTQANRNNENSNILNKVKKYKNWLIVLGAFLFIIIVGSIVSANSGNTTKSTAVSPASATATTTPTTFYPIQTIQATSNIELDGNQETVKNYKNYIEIKDATFAYNSSLNEYLLTVHTAGDIPTFFDNNSESVNFTLEMDNTNDTSNSLGHD